MRAWSAGQGRRARDLAEGREDLKGHATHRRLISQEHQQNLAWPQPCGECGAGDSRSSRLLGAEENRNVQGAARAGVAGRSGSAVVDAKTDSLSSYQPCVAGLERQSD